MYQLIVQASLLCIWQPSSAFVHSNPLKETNMFKAFSIATVALAAMSGSVKAQCGSTVLEQNFNQSAPPLC